MGILSSAMQPQSKINWLGVLADALSGAAGQTPLYTHMMMLKQQQANEDARYRQHQQSELENAKALYLWKQEHPDTPAPTEYERALTAAGIKPGTPEYIAHMSNYLKMKENPVWTYTDPTTGALMTGTKAPPPSDILTELPPGAKPIGGPSPGGSGGFR